MQYWLVKSEPETFSLDDFRAESVTVWYGVRNYQARNNLRAMQMGDKCLFYRSVTKPAVVATCEVVREHYQDPTTEETAWLAVDLRFVAALSNEVSLTTIKATPELADMPLLKASRLSVQPVSAEAYALIVAMGKEE
jgi:predicted RNA-binding protein with PUA-like domain